MKIKENRPRPGGSNPHGAGFGLNFLHRGGFGTPQVPDDLVWIPSPWGSKSLDPHGDGFGQNSRTVGVQTFGPPRWGNSDHFWTPRVREFKPNHPAPVRFRTPTVREIQTESGTVGVRTPWPGTIFFDFHRFSIIFKDFQKIPKAFFRSLRFFRISCFTYASLMLHFCISEA